MPSVAFILLLNSVNPPIVPLDAVIFPLASTLKFVLVIVVFFPVRFKLPPLILSADIVPVVILLAFILVTLHKLASIVPVFKQAPSIVVVPPDKPVIVTYPSKLTLFAFILIDSDV